MLKVLELLRKSGYLILFVVGISQILLYEAYFSKLLRVLKVELVWRFLENFGV